MAKMFQVYGVGQALIPVLPPPLPFENAPNSNQTNYEVGQLVYTPGPTATAFYLYAGAGTWVQITDSDGPVQSVLGTANQITVTTVAGVATVSLPAAIIAPGSLTTTTTLSAGTTVTAGTGVIATTGDITASAGDIVATLGDITADAGNIAATLGSVTAGTTVTAGTGVTATTGNITADGAGGRLQVHGGAVTDFIGQVTLASGVATVLNTNIAAGDKIFFSCTDINGSLALGVRITYTITPATSFAIDSLDATGATETADNSILEYVIIRQV